MNIDTDIIRRLRDGLVQRGSVSNGTDSDNGIPEQYQQAVLERFSPFAETMYLMMLIDGHAASAELDAIHGAMQIMTDNTLDHDALDEVFRICAKGVEEYGVEGRLQFVGVRLSSDRVDRETAFSLAAAVAIADKKLEKLEVTLMDSIAEWYGISSKRCKEILQEF